MDYMYICMYIYICMYVCLRKTDLLSIVKRSLLVGDSFGLYCPIYLYTYICILLIIITYEVSLY